MGCASSASGPKLSVIEKSFLGGIGSYDRDHDDVVTCDEWRTAAADLFAKADKSNTGALTEASYRSLTEIDRTFLVTPFTYFDTNGDAKIEKAEFLDRPNPAFTHADKDKDCKLTKLELATARTLSSSPQQSNRPKRSGNPVVGGPPGEGGY